MFMCCVATIAMLWLVDPSAGFEALDGVAITSPVVSQEDTPRIVLDAMEGFSVPEGAAEGVTRILDRHRVQLVRHRYKLDKKYGTARDRLKHWKELAVESGTEHCPVVLVPAPGAVLAAVREIEDPEVVSGLWFDSAQGKSGQYVARGRIPSSAMGTVAAPRPSLTIADLPYMVPAPLHPEETADRPYRLVTTTRINSIVSIVESRGERRPMIAVADGRPFASEYKREFPQADEIVHDLRVFHIPWVGASSKDPSLVDPEFSMDPALFGPVVGGQVRVGVPLALFEKFGGIICLVAAKDWKPFDPRYELRMIEDLQGSDEIRAIYVRVDQVDMKNDGPNQTSDRRVTPEKNRR